MLTGALELRELGLAGDAGAGPVPGHCGPSAVGTVLWGVQLALPRGSPALWCLRAAFPALCPAVIRVSAVASPEVPLSLVVTSAALFGLLSPEKCRGASSLPLKTAQGVS